MQLSEVTVTNYRSIVSQTRFLVGDFTVLVGPNNEGKSNLIRALSLAMSLIERWSVLPLRHRGKEELTGLDYVAMVGRPRRRAHGYVNALRYDWARDFPIAKQSSNRSPDTTIKLRFKLSADEVSSYKEATGLHNNGELPIEIKIGQNRASFGVKKQGKGAASYRAKAREIAAFVTSRMTFVTIPAIRTTAESLQLVNELAFSRLIRLRRSEEYQDLMTRLNELRQEAVSAVAEDLTADIQTYLPTIQSIDLETSDVRNDATIADFIIDDGTSTSIENKGDGVKSLVAIALIQALSTQPGLDRTVVLAIDEPEAHLHSDAVHRQAALFSSIATSQQVIIATHNPVLVNRDEVQNNIVVRGNTAKPATSLSTIRDALGIHLSDNLSSAELVLFTEGITDCKVLGILLARMNKRVGSAFEENRLVLKPARGVSKLRVQIQHERSTICRVLVALDDDEAGRQEAKLLTSSGVLKPRNMMTIGRDDSRESELEDMLDPGSYIQALRDYFQRDLTADMFRRNDKKWSDNLERAAHAVGYPITGTDIDKAKEIVADAVRNSTGTTSLTEEGRKRLEQMGQWLEQSLMAREKR